MSWYWDFRVTIKRTTTKGNVAVGLLLWNNCSFRVLIQAWLGCLSKKHQSVALNNEAPRCVWVFTRYANWLYYQLSYKHKLAAKGIGQNKSLTVVRNKAKAGRKKKLVCKITSLTYIMLWVCKGSHWETAVPFKLQGSMCESVVSLLPQRVSI